MRKRVVITGMGWVTPMGHSIESVWKRLLAGESGISRTTIFEAGTFSTSISAEVKDYRMEDFIGMAGPHAGVGRNTQFALGACARLGKRRDWTRRRWISIASGFISAAAKDRWISRPIRRDSFRLESAGGFAGCGEMD